jgi:hypothetical protein
VAAHTPTGIERLKIRIVVAVTSRGAAMVSVIGDYCQVANQ